MAEREWKPGDVAMVSIAGRPEQMMVRYQTSRRGGEVGWYQGWGLNAEGKAHYSDELSAMGAEARPLVVIDPEDREQVERLTELYLDVERNATESMQAALREFANPTPPKPDEPTGLGAVVLDSDGEQWLRCFGTPGFYVWRCQSGFETGRKKYADIAAVKVLSEGVR